MSPLVPQKWNIFESEREFTPEFFSGSPYHSLNFVLATIALCIDLGVGASIGLAFWSLLPGMIKELYLLVMIGLPTVWIRMIRDHRKMRTWYATAPPAEINSYPVRMASHLMTFAPYQLYFLVFLLLICLAGILRHQATLLH